MQYNLDLRYLVFYVHSRQCNIDIRVIQGLSCILGALMVTQSLYPDIRVIQGLSCV